MSEPQRITFCFGPFRVDGAERVLLRDGQPVSLTLKAFDVLLLLLENSGHIVEKDQLMDRVWPGTFVEEGNVKATVSMLRKALGDNQDDNRYIETVPRRGYRFVAEVKHVTSDNVDLVIRERTRESITIDEVQKIGSGSPSRRPLYFMVGASLVLLGVIAAVFFASSRSHSRAPATSSAPIRSIAVLPFKPLDSSKRDELLELGMADTLITRLGALRRLVIFSTGSVRKYTDLNQDPLSAGRALQADAVLDGSIQRVGDQIRVTVRLIRVADGSTLWAQPFDDRYDDLLAVEESISSKIVATLALTLDAEENRQLQKRHTNNASAYEAYLRGRAHWNRHTPDDFKKAIARFEDAIKLDPNYALAYAGLADTYNMMGYWGSASPREAFPKAKEAATRSLEIDKTLGEAHTALAYSQFEYDWNFTDAEGNYRRAIELNPGYVSAHQWYAEYLLISGRFEEAVQELQRARKSDPLSQPVNLIAASVPYMQRNYDESIAQLQKMLEFDPNYLIAYELLEACYSKKGMYEEALRISEREMTLSGEEPQTIESLRNAYRDGGINRYRLAHAEFLKVKSTRTYISPLFIAMDYARGGDTEKAFEWLEKAYIERASWLLELSIDPNWDNVRDDPRFKSLVERIKNGPKPKS